MVSSILKLSLAVLLLAQYVRSYEIDLLMPNVSPKVKDTYLCHAIKVNPDKPVYITEFIPNSKMEIAHHMLLFGCEEPALDDAAWDCGEMHSTQSDEPKQYRTSGVCRGGGQSIIYAWAMDAPKLVLPEEVAFKVGGNTKVKYIVLQVHYASIETFKNGGSDASGVTLVAQDEPVPKTAGVYLFSTGGYIKPDTKEYFEAACEVKQDIVMHPFAFRTHAHKLGLVTSGYRVTFDKKAGTQEWTEIGRRSPQLPQMFYPATNKVPIKKGDVVATRCTMKNFVDHNVYIGATGEDEMCNFYMMYYVDGDKLLDQNYCTTAGPPSWYFEDFKKLDGSKLDVSAIPEDASEIPVTNEVPSVHHNMNMNMNHANMDHNMMEMNSKEEETQNKNDDSVEGDNEVEEDDEDVEYLNRLEDDLVLKKLIAKYLSSEK